MMDERWKAYFSDEYLKLQKAKANVERAEKIRRNIDRTNSLLDNELGLVEERISEDHCVRFTAENRRIIQKDPVYKRLDNLRIPALQRTYEEGYLLVEKAIEKLQDSLFRRKMTEKHYKFLLESSNEACIKTLLCYFGINAAYNPNIEEKAA